MSGVPARYDLEMADRGGFEQEWNYEMGSDEPVTVVKLGDRTIIGVIVPWEPMESALEWSSRSGDTQPERFDLPDGRHAAFGEGQGGAWDDLVVEVGPTEALRISTKDTSRKELTEWAARFQSSGDRGVAPTVQDLPSGAVVVGSVQPDLLVALRAQVYRHLPTPPGPSSGYGIGWVNRQIQKDNTSLDSLAVIVVPASPGALEALSLANAVGAPKGSSSVEESEIKGRAALYINGSARFGSGQRVLVMEGEGETLIVVSAYGEQPPSASELSAIAGSVRRISSGQWSRFRDEIFGGPGLVADKGEHEITSGVQGSTGWLLQTITHLLPEGAEGQTGPLTSGPLGPKTVAVDECLKLSNRERACPLQTGGGANGSFYLWNKANSQTFDKADISDFILVTTSIGDAQRVRLRIGDDVTEAELHRVPEGDWTHAKVAVLFTDVNIPSLIPTCVDDLPPAPAGLAPARVDLLDASGAVIGCLGS